MFRSLFRFFGLNRLDLMLRITAERGGRSILLGWNRGLGDIALGLYAIVHRIREAIPDAKIAVMAREDLRDGFSMLEGVEFIGAPDWKRGQPYKIEKTKGYDLVIEKPSPTDWCSWQRGKLTPKLKWDPKNEDLHKKFDLPAGFTYVGVQVSAETNYGLWRNWPKERWDELFDRLAKLGHVRVLLFGFGEQPQFSQPNVIDLRGKTNLFELLSIIKNRCYGLVLPDSGISAMTYYLDEVFDLRHVTLWADPNHGILKQAVASPNPKLRHLPLIGSGDLSKVSAEMVFDALFPKAELKPLAHCTSSEALPRGEPIRNAACAILAGGQGTRLFFAGPKGVYPIAGKPLFQHLCEKIPVEMPIAIMTSPLNHAETVSFFEANRNFGREIFFVQQTCLPLLDEQYRELAPVPDGNGGVFSCLRSIDFEGRGIDTVLIIPVDNPLANPADGDFLAYHRKQRNDVTIKCIERNGGEKMGVLVEDAGKIAVAEYLDLTEEQLRSADFRYAYTGQIAVSVPFVRKAASETLPHRWVWKNGWKRERFIFDAFRVGLRVEAVCYPRGACYAPIKGPESVEPAERALGRR